MNARTIGHAHRVLSKALKEGMRHDLVIRNAAAMEAPPKVDEEEVVVLDGDQVKRMVDKLRGRAMYPRAVTALFTGIGAGNFSRFAGTGLTSTRRTTSTSRSVKRSKRQKRRDSASRSQRRRTACGKSSLPDIVVDALRDLRRQQLEQRIALGLGKLPDDALLFPKMDGTPQSPRAFSKNWADVAEDVGLPVTFHALRHTHASHLIDAGIDVVRISRRLGHVSPTITLKVYAHLFRTRDDKSTAAINAAVASLVPR